MVYECCHEFSVIGSAMCWVVSEPLCEPQCCHEFSVIGSAMCWVVSEPLCEPQCCHEFSVIGSASWVVSEPLSIEEPFPHIFLPSVGLDGQTQILHWPSDVGMLYKLCLAHFLC